MIVEIFKIYADAHREARQAEADWLRTVTGTPERFEAVHRLGKANRRAYLVCLQLDEVAPRWLFAWWAVCAFTGAELDAAELRQWTRTERQLSEVAETSWGPPEAGILSWAPAEEFQRAIVGSRVYLRPVGSHGMATLVFESADPVIGRSVADAWNARITAAARQRTRRVQGKEP